MSEEAKRPMYKQAEQAKQEIIASDNDVIIRTLRQVCMMLLQ